MKRYEEVRERIRRRPRRWLVTGAAGFIGSHLAQALLELDQKVVALDNFATGHPENLAEVKAAVGEERWRRFRFIEGDIRSLEDCRRACESVDLVLHEAALGSVPRSIDDPVASNAANVTGFLNMLVAARDAGVERLVYAGSSAAYGDHPAMPKVEPVIGRAVSPYGLTKHVNELYAEVFARCYGFDTIGLRYFNVFGPRQDAHGAYPSVIPAWIAAMLRDQPVYINGDPGISRDFCYVDNVVQANLLAATVDGEAAVNQVYNVAVGEQTTLGELFEMLKSQLAPRAPHVRAMRPVIREMRRGDLRCSEADIGKARRLLGFEPRYRVAQGLAESIDWYVLDAEQDSRREAAAA